jgi:acyl-CoA synthetase (AMP-forming)/AMP-acid ligase II
MYIALDGWDRNLDMLRDLSVHWIFSDSYVQHGHWTCCKEISVHGYTIALWKYDDTKNLSTVEETCNEDDWRMAYTVQTSGTTGCPKIVRVPHRCIVPNIQNLQ